MKRVIQQCSFLHHAPFATKEQDRSSNVCSSPLLLPDGKERDRSFISQVTGPSSLNCRQEETDRERGVRDRLHQKDVHARKGGIQSSGGQEHACTQMDGWMDAVVVRPPRGSGSEQGGSINRGMHYCASSEASSEIALGAGRRTKATSSMAGARTHAMPCLGAVPCRCSSTLCRQAGGARDSSCLIDGEIGEPDPTTGRAERTTRSLVEGVATTTTPAV
jgi:hypothetical protein